LSWSAIAQIESGRRTSLRPATLNALADALGVSVDYLLGRTPPPNTTPLLTHRALVYTTAEEFLAGVLPSFVEGMARGDPLLAVTTPSNGRALRSAFGEDRGAFRFVDSLRWYQSPAHTLNAYQSFIDEKIEAGAPLIRIIGEPVWSGRSAAEIDSWTRYEALLNVALAGTPAEIICPYNTITTPDAVLAGVHETHPEAIDTRAKAKTTPNYDPYHVLLRPPLRRPE
jgi:transcriptional regulator with XRE-family HTH domain